MSEPEATLPITRVTLYTSGVGYFERGGAVDGDAHLTLLFPVGQINDVLKSLVLLDTGDGQIQPVTYAAQDPVGRALQAFSVNVGDTPDRATLLNRVRGASVTVSTTQETLTGVIVGVESQTEFSEHGATTERYTLNLLADDGLLSIPLADVRRLQFNDARLRDELRQALAAVAQGRDADKRPLTLAFSGTGRRQVLVGYVAEAPAWQTTYRLVLGDTPLLQGWALVQNTGQDDWTDARLALVSGRPLSFIQDLYTPLYVRRPTVQPRIPASPTPQTYASDLMAERSLTIDAAPAEIFPAAAIPAPAPAGVSSLRQRKSGTVMDAMSKSASGDWLDQQSVAATGAQVGTALFAYHIDVPVTLPRSQSAMIPFTASAVQAMRVSVYNAQVQPGHPLSGVRLKNTTELHLMGGPLTVFEGAGADDGAGYVGDALMDDTEPGQSRLLTYAIDLAVDADRPLLNSEVGLLTLSVVRGVLKVSRKRQVETKYVFKNNGGAARTLLIEHPYPGDQWHLLEPAQAAERTAQVYRFALDAPAGASVNLSVRLELVTYEDVALADSSEERLLSFSVSGEMAPAVKAALEDLLRRRRALADAEIQIAGLDQQAERIAQEQARIRQNMTNLEFKSDLYKRYVGELDAQEDQLVELRARREALDRERTAAEEALDQYLSALDIP